MQCGLGVESDTTKGGNCVYSVYAVASLGSIMELVWVDESDVYTIHITLINPDKLQIDLTIVMETMVSTGTWVTRLHSDDIHIYDVVWWH